MDDLLFFDFETRSPLNVSETGAYQYARHSKTDITVFTAVFNDEPTPVILWSPPWAWGNTPDSRPDDPAQLERVFEHVRAGGYCIAWNSFFDRHIWNEVAVRLYGWPALERTQVLCAQAQAEGNNLPGALGKAAECLGTSQKKDSAGSQLMSQLAGGTRDDWDSAIFETHAKMGRFRKYGVDDTLALQEIWYCTRPLTVGEWEEFHASEEINDRGVMVDIEFARKARGYAVAEEKDINSRLAECTDDDRITVTNHTRKARWLHDQLWPDPDLQLLTKRPDKVTKLPDGSKEVKERFSADRPTRETVADLLATPEHAQRFADGHLSRIQEFIELIEAGNSAAVRKFTAMVRQEYQGRVYGCYSLNGAGQTGRFSSRGLQVHNIIRDPVDKDDPNRAIDAMEMVVDGVAATKLEKEFGFPISRLLARLIRPTFIAPPGKTFVWGDWGQIEGRMLPWLSASPGGEAKLDLYRAGVDVYSTIAGQITGKHAEQVTPHERQSMGKVPELALGFGGAVGAFAAMGRNYGVVLPVDEVRKIVTGWREQNDWCVTFWHKLWDAFMAAYSDPGQWYHAGRVKYLYHPQLMRGSMICQLPCGRWIVYPQFRHERVIVEDKETGEESVKWRTSCKKGFAGGYARVDLWYGTLAENITQGAAASVLRENIVDFSDVCVLHTHDELVLEVPQNDVGAWRDTLHDTMIDVPDWADGLPLSADIESGPFYTK